MYRITGIVLLVLLVLGTGAASAQDNDGGALQPSPVRWLVAFDKDVSRLDIQGLARDVGASAVEQGAFADFWLFRFDQAPDEDQVRLLTEAEGLRDAEREARFRTTMNRLDTLTGDPLRQRQWAHRMINLDTAHLLNFGADPSVTVAVLDTGVAYLNTAEMRMAPDLAGTIIYAGFDFVSDDALAVDEGDGEIGHGTFMTGVIAQTTFNMHGTAGIAFNASVLPVRVANRRGVARAAALARGIRYAVANGASVICLGVAGPADSRAVREAVEFAERHGVPVIAPAGNSEATEYPARYDAVISVGAVDAAGSRAYYSPEDGPVDLYAPGGDLRAGVDADGDGQPDGVLAESFLGRRYQRFAAVMMEGTSAAAAHVAGVSAMLISQVGHLTPERLLHALRAGARQEDGLLILDAGRTLLRAAELSR